MTGRSWRGAVVIAASVDGFMALRRTRLADRPPTRTPPHTLPGPVPTHRRGTRSSPPASAESSWAAAPTRRSSPSTRGRTRSSRVIVLSSTLLDDVDARVIVASSVPEVRALLEHDAATTVYVDCWPSSCATVLSTTSPSRAPTPLGRGLPLFYDLPHEARLVHLGTATSGCR